MRLTVRDIRKTASRNRLAIVLQIDDATRIFHATVTMSRINGVALPGVVYDRKLMETLQSNMLLAKPLIRAVINVHSGLAQSFPLVLGNFAPGLSRPLPRRTRPRIPARLVS